jgi:K+-transporting ATPase KdpF subunit
MDIGLIATGAISVALLVYLIVALLFPERFG